jgi:hypothetical protein
MSDARQKFQLEILESGGEIEAGSLADLPIDLETLKSLDEVSPLVEECFKGGLTAVVYKLSIAGKYYTLKKSALGSLSI